MKSNHIEPIGVYNFGVGMVYILNQINIQYYVYCSMNNTKWWWKILRPRIRNYKFLCP